MIRQFIQVTWNILGGYRPCWWCGYSASNLPVFSTHHLCLKFTWKVRYDREDNVPKQSAWTSQPTGHIQVKLLFFCLAELECPLKLWFSVLSTAVCHDEHCRVRTFPASKSFRVRDRHLWPDFMSLPFFSWKHCRQTVSENDRILRKFPFCSF